jgi:hypothetical protein
MKTLCVGLCWIILTQATRGDAQSFSDDFNRPDSSTVGNGWANTTGNVNGNLAISNNELTCSVPDGNAGIYRPFSFAAPVTVTALVKEMNGFGGLLRRYDSTVRILSDGVYGNGYGVQFGRGDQNFSDSSVSVFDGPTKIATLLSSFQYGPAINVSVTFFADGSVTGTVSQATDTFDFSFGTHTIQSSGGNFSYETSFPDSRSSSLVFPRMDDLSINSALTCQLNLTGFHQCDPPPKAAQGRNQI